MIKINFYLKIFLYLSQKKLATNLKFPWQVPTPADRWRKSSYYPAPATHLCWYTAERSSEKNRFLNCLFSSFQLIFMILDMQLCSVLKNFKIWARAAFPKFPASDRGRVLDSAFFEHCNYVLVFNLIRLNWGGETLVTKKYFCNRYKNFVTVTNVFVTKMCFFTEIPTSHYRRFLQFLARSACMIPACFFSILIDSYPDLRRQDVASLSMLQCGRYLLFENVFDNEQTVVFW